MTFERTEGHGVCGLPHDTLLRPGIICCTSIPRGGCIYLCSNPACPFSCSISFFGVELPLGLYQLVVSSSSLLPKSHTRHRARNKSTSECNAHLHLITRL